MRLACAGCVVAGAEVGAVATSAGFVSGAGDEAIAAALGCVSAGAVVAAGAVAGRVVDEFPLDRRKSTSIWLTLSMRIWSNPPAGSGWLIRTLSKNVAR